MGARETALNVLIACRKDSAWSNGVLKEYITRDRLDRREASLATRLCYGVMQNRMLLDFYLKQLLTGKIKDLHPVVHDILHLGLYQIYALDKIPDSAAVNESVTLAKKYCRRLSYASGLVNAVLRNAIRTKEHRKEPQTLADRYSHPQKLIDMLSDYVGEDRLEKMLQANNGIPETVIQVNTLKISTEALICELEEKGIAVQPHPWMPDCLTLSGTGNLEQLEAFRSGKFYVQDAAARLSVVCAQIPEKAQVLDCCAAPGGKSFAAAIAMNGTGKVCACDVHPHKTALIQNGASRLALTNISVFLQDATQERAGWQESMDVVIADVPCSGYGIIRKKPDIRYKNLETMRELPGLQLKILKQQAGYVKPGGTLLYSTCTLVREENEGVVERFLSENEDFYREALSLPAVFPENRSGMLTLVPGEYETDGFFICRLRRRT